MNMPAKTSAKQPKTIGDLIDRDLSRRIEEIIKLDQLDEQTVYEEITEYVATDQLKEHYRTLLKAVADFPSDPHEGVGVWVSGFFGSGKSSFAKNLGYVLANRTVLGKRAAELFKARLNDAQCGNFIDVINKNIDTEVVMFDVQTDRASGGGAAVSISHYMYRSLLRTLGYAEDLDIADLEQSLEEENRLEQFVKRFEARYGDWNRGRKSAEKMNRASAILNEMDRDTYPQADSWAKAQAQKRIEVTPGFLVQKAFELSARRRPKKTLAFLIDEVGAYVANSAERIEDLRAVVEQFGKESKNRVRARQAPGPIWILVTSQEKLDEVVAAIGPKRVDIAKLQDRFRYRIDLAPADIREVASKRVLLKTDAGEKLLRAQFRLHEGQLNNQLRLDSKSRRTEISERDFADFYPYPPHFIDLSIDIMSGIRLQPGSPRQLGGSNRTIIKQAFEMLASERTGLARAEIGRMVTLDLVFELVEGNLSTETRKDISDIAKDFGVNSWEARVAKAVVLLQVVRDLPRTDANVAAVLLDRLDTNAPLPQVRDALTRLQEAKYVRHTDEGFKLQTASEKNWETERRAIDPRPRDRAEIFRAALVEAFSEPALRVYSYKGLRNFRVGLTVDGIQLEDGNIPVHLITADSERDLGPKKEQAQVESRKPQSASEIFWTIALNPEIDNAIAELFRARQMVNKYEQIGSQGRMERSEDAGLLANEKQEIPTIQAQLRKHIETALQGGAGFFRGLSVDGSAFGKTVSEVFRKVFDKFVPDLYSKLEMGAKPLKEHSAEDVLKAANLSGLATVFYEGADGYGLVIQDGNKYLPNRDAPVAKEIMAYIRERASYGEKVSGKDLEQRFCGLNYGWERDLIQTVLAVLLRAGAIEVTYQGRRFKNHMEAAARVPFTTTTAFRNASYAPREMIALKTLTTAAERYEEITGQEVDVEESAIAQAFKKVAEQEQMDLLPILAKAQANALPFKDELAEYQSTLSQIANSATDDCVRMLADEGRSLKQSIEQARTIREKLTDHNLDALRKARVVIEQLWPSIEGRQEASAVQAQADDLKVLIASPTLYQSMTEIERLASDVEAAYEALYTRRHKERQRAIDAEIESIKGHLGWAELPEETRAPLLIPLESRLCDELDRPEGAQVCNSCRATIAQLESDLAAAPGLRNQIVAKIQEQLSQKPVRRLRISDLFEQPLDSEASVQHFIDLLRDELMKLMAEGVRVIIE